MRSLNEPLRLNRVWKAKAFAKEQARSTRIREQRF